MTIHDKAQLAKVRDNLKYSIIDPFNLIPTRVKRITKKQIKLLNELILK